MTRKHSWCLSVLAVCTFALVGCDSGGNSNEAVILPPDPSTAPKYPNPNAGGGEDKSEGDKGDESEAAPAENAEEPAEGKAASNSPNAAAEPGGRGPGMVAINNGVGEITAQNARIVFVGKHTNPEKPDPRTGGFEEFGGTVEVAGGKITALEIDIDMNSVFTFQDKLTNHLKNADFFETNEFPQAKFKLASVADDGAVSGELTLHGVTKAITFPADVRVTDAGVSLQAKFPLNRFDFNMNGVKDNVANEVEMSISLGQGTNKEAILGGGGGRGARRGGGGRGFDPMAMFERQDADKDGILKDDEIPERMRGRLEMIDTDGNGEISKEEIKAIAERMGGGRGGQ